MCAINRYDRHRNVSNLLISALRINEKAEISVNIIHTYYKWFEERNIVER